MSQLSWNLHGNGTVSLQLNRETVLTTGWGVDCNIVRPCSVNVEENTSILRGESESRFQMHLQQNGESGLALECSAACAAPPRFLYPVFQTALIGVRGLFRQGFGLGGPSGWLTPEEIRKSKIAYSYGMTVLRFDGGYLGVFARDARRYIQRCEIQPDHVTEGIYNFPHAEEVFRFSAGFQTELAGTDYMLPALEFIAGDTLEGVLAVMTEAIAAEYKPPVPMEPAYHWCSWYYYYNNFDYPQLREFLDELRELEPSPPLKYIQIDAGYFPAAGDWLEANHLWPGGLKAAFDLIRERGYRPGIWIAPFMVGCRSRLFAEHPEWLLRKNDGSYVREWQMYNEPKVWGYQDEEYYVLDTSHPKAMEYLRMVFRTLHAWGAEFFKTDFMLWGVQDSAGVQRHCPGKTTVEYYRDMMAAIQEEIGESYWLGCIAPYLPSLGFVNGMRIAGDVFAVWEDNESGAGGMIRQAVGDNQLNGRFWQNDPDALILRDFHVFMNEREVSSLALFQALSGGMTYTSDPLGRIAEKRRELFRFIRPTKISRPDIPKLESGEPVVVLHHKDGQRHILFFLNPTMQEQTVCYSFADICGKSSLILTEWHGQWVPSEVPQTGWAGKIPAHGSVLLYGGENEAVREINNLWLDN